MESRRLTLPQKLEDYKLELKSDFKVPEGMAPPAFDETDPMSQQFRAVALKHGWTQEAASDVLAVYAAAKLGEDQTLKAAREGEVAKLGPAGTQRIDALRTWLKAMDVAQLGDVEKGVLWTAETVSNLEKLMARFTSQGSGDFSQAHREHGEINGKIPGYDTMTFEQRRAAQDNARRPGAGGK